VAIGTYTALLKKQRENPHAEVQSHWRSHRRGLRRENRSAASESHGEHHANNPFGIQLRRYWPDAPVPELVKRVAHVAFEVDDLDAALQGRNVIIAPNSPSKGVRVAVI
jgi:hypothetical protein